MKTPRTYLTFGGLLLACTLTNTCLGQYQPTLQNLGQAPANPRKAGMASRRFSVKASAGAVLPKSRHAAGLVTQPIRSKTKHMAMPLPRRPGLPQFRRRFPCAGSSPHVERWA